MSCWLLMMLQWIWEYRCLIEILFLFLWINTQEWNCRIKWKFCFSFFWGTCILFSTVTAPIYIPINSVGCSLFLTFLPALVISVLFRVITFLCWNEAHAVSSSRLFILPTKKWVSRGWYKFPKLSQMGLHHLSVGQLDNLVCFWGKTINLPCLGVGGLLVNNGLTPCEAMDTHLITELYPVTASRGRQLNQRLYRSQACERNDLHKWWPVGCSSFETIVVSPVRFFWV